MNAKRKYEPDDEAQSAKFVELAERLVSSGDLQPTDDRFRKALRVVIPKKQGKRKVKKQ